MEPHLLPPELVMDRPEADLTPMPLFDKTEIDSGFDCRIYLRDAAVNHEELHGPSPRRLNARQELRE